MAVPVQLVEASAKLWRPRRVLITPDALQWEHGRAIAERAAGMNIPVIELKANRLSGFRDGSSTEQYVNAKTTLAVVVAPASARKLQPIPPSADWQFHLAEGCPAHCQYCYLAGSLSGPPVTRVFANLPEILAGLPEYLGKGTITSQSAARSEEGTTFEVSCYTDPLGIEHLTGSLAECIRFFGNWEAPVQLRWTTKFNGVTPLLSLEHRGRTRVRFSVNAAHVARNFEGGTSAVSARLQAMRAMAQAGYPVGLTIAPIMPIAQWQEEYGDLLRQTREALSDIPQLDLTVELITHRFTPKSKLVLLDWYPKTKLSMDEAERSKKMTKFGSAKYVYPNATMRAMHEWFNEAVGRELPSARVLYWT
ncbi:MAG: radical SAM protein [Rhodospirillales bacterium]|nr:radical SAM protein [Acetobacter sp.]